MLTYESNPSEMETPFCWSSTNHESCVWHCISRLFFSLCLPLWRSAMEVVSLSIWNKEDPDSSGTIWISRKEGSTSAGAVTWCSSIPQYIFCWDGTSEQCSLVRAFCCWWMAVCVVLCMCISVVLKSSRSETFQQMKVIVGWKVVMYYYTYKYSFTLKAISRPNPRWLWSHEHIVYEGLSIFAQNNLEWHTFCHKLRKISAKLWTYGI